METKYVIAIALFCLVIGFSIASEVEKDVVVEDKIVKEISLLKERKECEEAGGTFYLYREEMECRNNKVIFNYKF